MWALTQTKWHCIYKAALRERWFSVCMVWQWSVDGVIKNVRDIETKRDRKKERKKERKREWERKRCRKEEREIERERERKTDGEREKESWWQLCEVRNAMRSFLYVALQLVWRHDIAMALTCSNPWQHMPLSWWCCPELCHSLCKSHCTFGHFYRLAHIYIYTYIRRESEQCDTHSDVYMWTCRYISAYTYPYTYTYK